MHGSILLDIRSRLDLQRMRPNILKFVNRHSKITNQVMLNNCAVYDFVENINYHGRNLFNI